MARDDLSCQARAAFDKQRELLLGQCLAVQGLMQILMTQRNTGRTWTNDEARQIRGHLRTLVRLLPIVLVFLLPGGLLLLPAIAEVLDSRQAPCPYPTHRVNPVGADQPS